MESQFDYVRETYNELADRTFPTEALHQEYIVRLNNVKNIADAIADFRATPDAEITTAAESFLEIAPPITREACSQISTYFMNATDPDDPSYSSVDMKSNTIQALVYIHWEFYHLAIEAPHEQPTKLSIVQNIAKKLVDSTLLWGYTIQTTKDDFVQMQRDLRDNKPLHEIMNNFHYSDLTCYGF